MNLRLLCSLVGMCLACWAGEPSEALSVGANWPLSFPAGADVLIVLVTDSSQCYSCAPLSRTIRQIPTDSSGVVRTAILAVDVPTSLMSNTVRAERLEGVEVIPLGRGPYHRLFGPLPIPALLVVHSGVVRWRWHVPVGVTPSPVLSRETATALEEVIRDVLRPSAVK